MDECTPLASGTPVAVLQVATRHDVFLAGAYTRSLLSYTSADFMG